MRIALLNESSPHSLLTEAEAQRYGIAPGHSHPWVRNLAEGLARIPGNAVHVVGMTGQLPADLHRTRNGVQYHFLHSASAPVNAVTLFEANAWKVRSFLRSLGVEIVNPHSLARAGYFGVRSSLPAVFTIHGLDLREWLASSPEPWLQTRLLLHYETTCRRRARHFIFVSAALLKKQSFLHKDANIALVENALAIEYYTVRELAWNSDFLFVGSLQPRKAPLDLLKALVLVPAARARLIFQAAQTDYLAEMKQFVAEHDLAERTHFVGSLEPEQIAQELSRCRALVLTSYLETAPMVIAEAMAVGKPVIATRVNGVPLMVTEGQSGWLFEPGDVQTLSNHMLQLLNDTRLSQKMGAAGRQIALARWHPDHVARQNMAVYEKVLGA